MKIKILKHFGLCFVLLAAIALYSCKNNEVNKTDKNEIVVFGNLLNGAEKQVSLEEMLAKETKLLDESTLDKDGQFTLKTKAEEVKVLYFKTEKGQFITLIAHPGETIEINGDYSKLSIDYNLIGSPQTQKLMLISEMKKPFLKQLDSLAIVWRDKRSDENKLIIKDQLDTAVVEIIREFKEEMETFIQENDSSLLSIFAFYQNFGQRKVFDEQKDSALFRQIIMSLVAKYPDNFHTIENYKRYLSIIGSVKSNGPGNMSGNKFPEVLITNAEDEGQFPSDFYGREMLYCFFKSIDQGKEKMFKELNNSYQSKSLRLVAIYPPQVELIKPNKNFELEGQFAEDEKSALEIFDQREYPFYVLVGRNGIIRLIASDIQNIQSELSKSLH